MTYPTGRPPPLIPGQYGPPTPSHAPHASLVPSSSSLQPGGSGPAPWMPGAQQPPSQPPSSSRPRAPPAPSSRASAAARALPPAALHLPSLAAARSAAVTAAASVRAFDSDTGIDWSSASRETFVAAFTHVLLTRHRAELLAILLDPRQRKHHSLTLDVSLLLEEEPRLAHSLLAAPADGALALCDAAFDAQSALKADLTAQLAELPPATPFQIRQHQQQQQQQQQQHSSFYHHHSSPSASAAAAAAAAGLPDPSLLASSSPKPETTVLLFNLPPCAPYTRPLRSLFRASDDGSLVSVAGTLVRTGQTGVFEDTRQYECARCGHRFVCETTVEEKDTLTLPRVCPSRHAHAPSAAVAAAEAAFAAGGPGPAGDPSGAGAGADGDDFFASLSAAAAAASAVGAWDDDAGGSKGKKKKGGGFAGGGGKKGSGEDKPQLCSSSKFIPLEGTRTSRDYQEIRLKESYSTADSRDLPCVLTVILLDDAVGTLRVGCDVVVTGIARRQWRGGGVVGSDKRCDLDGVIVASHVFVVNDGVTRAGSTSPVHTHPSPSSSSTPSSASGALMGGTAAERESLLSFLRTHRRSPLQLRARLIASFCPQLCGLGTEKLAALLMLMGGVARDGSGGSDSGTGEGTGGGVRVRGSIHLLIIGPPSRGKSQLMRAVAALSPRSVITTGTSTSAAGLTASASSSSAAAGEGGIEAGALVLADGGVCCVDEFGCVRKSERAALLEAMEQQTVSVTKAGAAVLLPARTAVFATQNPRNPDGSGCYDPQLGLSANTGIEPPLLSRFDLIVVMGDADSSVWDRTVAAHVLGLLPAPRAGAAEVALTSASAAAAAAAAAAGGENDDAEARRARASLALLRAEVSAADDAATALFLQQQQQTSAQRGSRLRGSSAVAVSAAAAAAAAEAADMALKGVRVLVQSPSHRLITTADATEPSSHEQQQQQQQQQQQRRQPVHTAFTPPSHSSGTQGGPSTAVASHVHGIASAPAGLAPPCEPVPPALAQATCVPTPLPPALLRRYLAHSRALCPDISPFAYEVLARYFRLRRYRAGTHTALAASAASGGATSDGSVRSLSTARLLEALLRLVQAHARLLGRGRAVGLDAVCVVILVEYLTKACELGAAAAAAASDGHYGKSAGGVVGGGYDPQYLALRPSAYSPAGSFHGGAGDPFTPVRSASAIAVATPIPVAPSAAVAAAVAVQRALTPAATVALPTHSHSHQTVGEVVWDPDAAYLLDEARVLAELGLANWASSGNGGLPPGESGVDDDDDDDDEDGVKRDSKGGDALREIVLGGPGRGLPRGERGYFTVRPPPSYNHEQGPQASSADGVEPWAGALTSVERAEWAAAVTAEEAVALADVDAQNAAAAAAAATAAAAAAASAAAPAAPAAATAAGAPGNSSNSTGTMEVWGSAPSARPPASGPYTARGPYGSQSVNADKGPYTGAACGPYGHQARPQHPQHPQQHPQQQQHSQQQQVQPFTPGPSAGSQSSLPGTAPMPVQRPPPAPAPVHFSAASASSSATASAVRPPKQLQPPAHALAQARERLDFLGDFAPASALLGKEQPQGESSEDDNDDDDEEGLSQEELRRRWERKNKEKKKDKKDKKKDKKDKKQRKKDKKDKHTASLPTSASSSSGSSAVAASQEDTPLSPVPAMSGPQSPSRSSGSISPLTATQGMPGGLLRTPPPPQSTATSTTAPTQLVAFSPGATHSPRVHSPAHGHPRSPRAHSPAHGPAHGQSAGMTLYDSSSGEDDEQPARGRKRRAINDDDDDDDEEDSELDDEGLTVVSHAHAHTRPYAHAHAHAHARMPAQSKRSAGGGKASAGGDGLRGSSMHRAPTRRDLARTHTLEPAFSNVSASSASSTASAAAAAAAAAAASTGSDNGYPMPLIQPFTQTYAATSASVSTPQRRAGPGVRPIISPARAHDGSSGKRPRSSGVPTSPFSKQAAAPSVGIDSRLKRALVTAVHGYGSFAAAPTSSGPSSAAGTPSSSQQTAPGQQPPPRPDVAPDWLVSDDDDDDDDDD